jgi:hypothetical protein
VRYYPYFGRDLRLVAVRQAPTIKPLVVVVYVILLLGTLLVTGLLLYQV